MYMHVGAPTWYTCTSQYKLLYLLVYMRRLLHVGAYRTSTVILVWTVLTVLLSVQAESAGTTDASTGLLYRQRVRERSASAHQLLWRWRSMTAR